MLKKVVFLSLIALLVVAFFGFGFDHYLSLDGVKQLQIDLATWRAERPVILAVILFFSYIVITALSLPGAAVMTLLVGGIFGLAWGVLIASFASSIGATLAFIMTRYVLRDSVQRRFSSRLKAINDGVARDGSFYLFSLRLVPVFPFFLINMLMALTSIKLRQFYWVSQLGMLPVTLVYVNAGSQLSELSSLSGILSPSLLFSFVLLGVFPLLAKKSLGWLAARKKNSQWSRPRKFDRNLIVIGGGAAGLVSAYIAAAVKAKVTLVEAHKMGGDCLNYGCVPSKALIKTAKLAAQQRHGERYGLGATQPHIDFRRIMARVNDIIAKIEPHDSVARYTELGVEVLQGYARLIDPWTVEIALNDGGVQRLTSRAIVIAAGAEPVVPPLPGLDAVGYVTSDTLWESLAESEKPPARLLVLGAGQLVVSYHRALQGWVLRLPSLKCFPVL